MKTIIHNMNIDFEKKINQFLENSENIIFNEILKYSLFESKGKKLRPLIGYIFSKYYFNINTDFIINFLIGIELIHLYSLVHDDLPAIDNDEYRRGLKTIHAKYGEHNAILFGDGLQALALNFFLEDNTFFESQNIINLAKIFTDIIGPNKLLLGQMLDINITKKTFLNSKIDYDLIFKIHKNKTAVFFAFCASMGGILSGKIDLSKKAYEFGMNFGLAFQIFDDINDFEKKNDEINILNIIKIDDAKKLLESNINFLENFIKEQINIESQIIFHELISILK